MAKKKKPVYAFRKLRLKVSKHMYAAPPYEFLRNHKNHFSKIDNLIGKFSPKKTPDLSINRIIQNNFEKINTTELKILRIFS